MSKSALKQSHGRPGMAVLVSVLFFFAVAGLYIALGTFTSSCGPSQTTTTSIRIRIPNGLFNCIPPSYGQYVDFWSARNTGWGVTLEILNPALSSAFYTYNFVTTNTSNGANITSNNGGIQIENVTVPFDTNYPYRVRLTMLSPCHCGAWMQQRRNFVFVTSQQVPYSYPSVASDIGIFPGAPNTILNCN